MSKRISFLDNSRAICMLYIVGFWHMQEYTEYSFFTPLTYAMTRGVLAAFFFISALMEGKKQIKNFNDAWKICKRRLIRIYPLFFVSCTTLYLIHVFWGQNYMLSASQYILTLMGIACIITPAPSTVWFINMIFMFDLIALLINSITTYKWKFISCSCILGGIFLAKNFFEGLDDRILIYCPIYCIGLLLSAVIQLSESVNYYVLIGGAVVFAGLYAISDRYIVVNILVSLACVMIIFEIGKLLSKNGKLRKVLSWISYGSMCAYLFHRQILYTIYRYKGIYTMWFSVLIMLPLVVITSYYLQLMYDKICSFLSGRQKVKKEQIRI